MLRAAKKRFRVGLFKTDEPDFRPEISEILQPCKITKITQLDIVK